MDKVIHGNNKDVLKTLADNSVDAIVTDPPYELGFMEKSWDASGIAYDIELWKEVYRVLKPGGHLLSFGGTRTYHRMVCAIEDAGFEIRDQIQWLYGSGFPHSQNICKAIDKKFGASQAERWDGWGTALKPANEPIVLARKPLSEKTIAANILKWGTGGINVGDCRVGDEKVSTHSRGKNSASPSRPGEKAVEDSGRITDQREKLITGVDRVGRYPSNVIRDNDQQVLDLFPTDKKGSLARFFYSAKTSTKERTCNGQVENKHPTVKPIALMSYLCRLVTPPSGTVLDPFGGSGTTALACMKEGFDYILIELEEDSYNTCLARIAAESQR